MDKVDIKIYSEEQPKPRLWGTITSIIIALAALFAAGISWQTLTHMKDQLEISTQPQIKINDSEIYIHIDRVRSGVNFGYLRTYVNNGLPDQEMLEKNESGMWKIKNRDDLNKFKINIVNIGQRPAKDLKLEWTIDTSAWNKLFSNFVGLIGFKSLGFESPRLDTSVLYFNESYDTSWYHNIYYTRNINYLLSQNNDPDDVFIRLPENYIRLFCFYKFYKSEYIRKYHNVFEDNVPPLNLNIKFQDIRNEDYDLSFELKLEQHPGLNIFGGGPHIPYIAILTIMELN